MTVKELKEKIKDMPDDAHVKCESRYNKDISDVEYREDYVYNVTFKTVILK